MIIIFITCYIDFFRQILLFPKSWVKEPLQELWPNAVRLAHMYWTNHLDMIYLS